MWLQLTQFFITLCTAALAFFCGVLCLVVLPTPVEPLVGLVAYAFIALSCIIASLGIIQVLNEHRYPKR
jgi:hypothetical protein